MANSSFSPPIVFEDLTLSRSNRLLLNQTNLTVPLGVVAIVGENGCGKSTLLQAIAGLFSPSSGQIIKPHHTAYLPQFVKQNGVNQTGTFIELLLGSRRGLAFQRVLGGTGDLSDFEYFDEDLAQYNGVIALLERFHCKSIDANTSLAELSGGELSKIAFAIQIARKTDYLLLDEPTNYLDYQSKMEFISAMRLSNIPALVASHDRVLLQHVDHIFAFRKQTLYGYGGNYEAYVKQRSLEDNAVRRQYEDARNEVQLVQKSLQRDKEKAAQRSKSGKKNRSSGSQPKVMMDFKKNRSGQTMARLAKAGEQRLQHVRDRLAVIKEQHVELEALSFSLPEPPRPDGRLLLDVNGLSFSYNDQPLLDNLHLQLYGGERIAIEGRNGSGKSTFMKILMGELRSQSGTVVWRTRRIGYLDQFLHSTLANESIYEMLRNIHENMTETELRQALAKFQLKGELIYRNQDELSGGQKMRAALARIFIGDVIPEVLLLDEPTNHLDPESVTYLQELLTGWRGSLIVISHDAEFKHALKCQPYSVELSNQCNVSDLL